MDAKFEIRKVCQTDPNFMNMKSETMSYQILSLCITISKIAETVWLLAFEEEKYDFLTEDNSVFYVNQMVLSQTFRQTPSTHYTTF